MGNSLFQKIAIGTAQFGLDYGIANNNGQIEKNEKTKITAPFTPHFNK